MTEAKEPERIEDWVSYPACLVEWLKTARVVDRWAFWLEYHQVRAARTLGVAVPQGKIDTLHERLIRSPRYIRELDTRPVVEDYTGVLYGG